MPTGMPFTKRENAAMILDYYRAELKIAAMLATTSIAIAVLYWYFW